MAAKTAPAVYDAADVPALAPAYLVRRRAAADIAKALAAGAGLLLAAALILHVLAS